MKNEELFAVLLPRFSQHQQRTILRVKDNKLSTWLTIVPLAKNHFDLSAQEFWDGLALRYKKVLSPPPSAVTDVVLLSA